MSRWIWKRPTKASVYTEAFAFLVGLSTSTVIAVGGIWKSLLSGRRRIVFSNQLAEDSPEKTDEAHSVDSRATIGFVSDFGDCLCLPSQKLGAFDRECFAALLTTGYSLRI